MTCLEGAAAVAVFLLMISARYLQRAEAATCGANEIFLTLPSVYVNDTSYTGEKVDWKRYMDAIDCMGRKEHAFCTFVTRMFFHDAGAIEESPKTPGSDGSLLINKAEGIAPPNVLHGEAPMVRYVLKNFVNKYNASWSDGLTVAAAACSNTLGSPFSIAQLCDTAGTPFYVGKLDNEGLSVAQYKAQMLGDLPGGTTNLTAFITFWKSTLNSYVSDSNWQFNFKDVSALMGSHALLFNHSCTQNERGQRNKYLDNSYYKDLLSGNVSVHSPGDSCGSDTCVAAADGESKGCEFDQETFKNKTDVALEQVADAQEGVFTSTATTNPPFVNWVPDSSRATCFGTQCKACSSADTGSTSSRPFCHGRQVGESYWPYTVNDGHLAGAAKNPSSSDDDQVAISEAFKLFKSDLGQFRKYYASGVCKLVNLAASYNSKTNLYKQVGNYCGKCSSATTADKSLVESIFKC